jgi:CheY-like chemotaxis protein
MQVEQAETRAADFMARQKKTSRILLVDDEPVAGLSTSRMLSFLGYEVELATSAQEALKSFKKNRFHLVIADYAMPGMKGDALAEAIKRVAPEQPILLVSGFVEHVLENSGLSGVDLVIGKPFELGALRRAIAELCEDSDEPQVAEAAG